MAALLPRSFALKSNNNKKYLRYIHQSYENLHGILQFSEVDVKSPNAKFQMEPAYGGYEGLVHIKCCYNNKYLRRANDHQHWIVAQADEPEEDLNHWSCTLFEPRVVHPDNKTVLRILHVQLGHYVMSLTSNDFHQCLFAEKADPNLQNDLDLCIVVDLDPLALPNPFVLKSNNCNKYLRYILDEENPTHEIVQFSGKDPKSEYSIFQVEQANNQDDQANHYVHIKCIVNNKYFRRMDKDKQLIMAVADQRDENKNSWACTLFKPEHVGQASNNNNNNNNNVLCRLRHIKVTSTQGHLLRIDSNYASTTKDLTPKEWMSTRPFTALHDHHDRLTFVGSVSENSHETSLVPSESPMGLKKTSFSLFHAIVFPKWH